MIVNKKKLGIEIDLSGPQGNAFYLIGQANKLAEQLNFDKDEIVNEMTKSDYENLILVFDKYFGSYITMYK